MNPKDVIKKHENDPIDELRYIPLEIEQRISEGPRGFFYGRKLTLSNYDPRRKFETEDFGVTHDSFAQARVIVEDAVKSRIAELRGVEALPIKK